jgi:hypothetical protein
MIPCHLPPPPAHLTPFSCVRLLSLLTHVFSITAVTETNLTEDRNDSDCLHCFRSQPYVACCIEHVATFMLILPSLFRTVAMKFCHYQ